MDKGFIKSKINIPKVKYKLVKRVALFDKLNEAINYKLILVRKSFNIFAESYFI